MSKEDNGGAAFPCQAGYDFKGEHVTTTSEGMTLRDYFAAKTLAALIVANKDPMALGENNLGPNMKFAKASYAIADAMLEARKK